MPNEKLVTAECGVPISLVVCIDEPKCQPKFFALLCKVEAEVFSSCPNTF